MKGAWVAVLLVLTASGCSRKHPDAKALSPEESLKAMHLSEDFRVELFAAEPLVVDPVEMAFDENGRMYVAEMIDYPDDPPKGRPARSRIKLLEDTDGDGRPDRGTIFADRVLEVSGLLPWGGGLLVASAPDILFFKDTDGDGKADLRRVLYTGFPKVNPEGRITNLRLGIDNWIYAANSGADGRITSPDHPERPPILVRGADFRFHPLRGIAEPASGPTQFGMSFDEWGNRFLTQNTVHVRNAVLPMQYLARAPLLEVRAVSQDISDHGRPDVPIFPLTKPQQWREQRTKLRQQRYDENKLNRVERVGGFFTAASGGTVYTGDAFPAEYRGSLFTGDVSANLVHRDILVPDGVTFLARRAKPDVEFLASTDVWFRPCNFANAPDGNLYMLDIYREFIETPESIPEEIKKNMDFWSGSDRGRIYRIVPRQPRRKGNLKPGLGSASTAELVRQLENPNGWHRQTAQRLLIQRGDRGAAPALAELARKSASPLARVHALWTLEGLNALDETLVAAALRDPDPHVREHALRLAEPFLPKSPSLANAALALERDSAPRVQFQLALSLGQLPGPRALDALAGIARTRAEDPWFRTAVLSSAAQAAGPFLRLLAARGVHEPRLFEQLCGLIGARRDPAELAAVFESSAKLPEPAWAAALGGLARGLKLAGARGLRVPAAEAVLGRSFQSPSAAAQNAAWEVARYFDLPALIRRAAADALAPGLPPARRAIAVRALRGSQFATAAPLVRKLLEGHPPPELQVAAVDALSAFDDPAVAPTLLGLWKGFSPPARRRTITALLEQRQRVPLLLKAMQGGQIEAAALDLDDRARLVGHPDPAISAQARALFHTDHSERGRVLAAYQDAVKLAGHPDHGKAVFDENCARCHMPRRAGGRVGPDLSGINNKTREELLKSILDPSSAIEARYVNYMVTTHDGRMYDGVIANETPGAVTLRGGSEEGDQTILRRDIAEIRASSVSLMPEGLEKSLSKQDLADVIAYLRGGL